MIKLLTKLFIKDPKDRGAYGKLSGVTGIICNMLLAAAKLFIGLLSGSVSVMADAMNNFTDAASSIVTLIGFRMAEKPADKDHPYGHARAEYISGLAVAALILLIGWELGKTSFQKILHPEPVEFSVALILVLVISIAGKLWLSHLNRQLGKAIGSNALLAAAADSRNDVIATSAVLLSCIIGRIWNLNLDGYMGLAVAVFIFCSGIGIAKDTVDPLLGQAPDKELVEHIRKTLLSYEHVLGIHDLMVHDYGPGRRFASVHVEMDRELDSLFAHNIIDEIERDFEKNDNLQMVLHYDPMVTDDEELNKAKAMIESIVHAIDENLSLHDFRLVAGPKHTNVVFDLVVPFDMKDSPSALKKRIAKCISEILPNYYAVIHIDSEGFSL